MITPGAIGSPIVQPFFFRAPVSSETIVRTTLGSASDASAGIANLKVTGVNCAASDFVLVGLVYNDQIDVDALAVDLNGNALTNTTARVFGSAANYNAAIWRVNGVAAAGGVITADFSMSTAEPQQACMLAIKVSGLTAQDRTHSAAGSSFLADSGATVATTVPHEFVWGIIGLQRPSTDTDGSWSVPLNPGMRVTAPGVTCDLMEAYAVVNAISTYRAQLSIPISRPWGAICQTYR